MENDKELVFLARCTLAMLSTPSLHTDMGSLGNRLNLTDSKTADRAFPDQLGNGHGHVSIAQPEHNATISPHDLTNVDWAEPGSAQLRDWKALELAYMESKDDGSRESILESMGHLVARAVAQRPHEKSTIQITAGFTGVLRQALHPLASATTRLCGQEALKVTGMLPDSNS